MRKPRRSGLPQATLKPSRAEVRGRALQRVQSQGWASLNQTAQVLHTQAPKVQEWLETEQLMGFQLNGRWRVMEEELERYKREGLRPPKADSIEDIDND